jgi:ornithine cyclodeaminase/alanine dehydrogenase-like protein (mu-crystallin family)
MTSAPTWVDATALAAAVTPDDARRGIEAALAGGLDPADDPERSVVPAGRGHLLLMPSSTSSAVGVKVASVAPHNPEIGKERIQALYLLMDAATLTPSMMLDGTALTALRTPAMSAVAVDYLATTNAEHLLVFGTGPQARGHLEAVRQVRHLTEVTIVGRRRSRAEELCEEAIASGLNARLGTPEAVGEADIIVCATSAAEPLFDGGRVSSHACVVAIGSHEPDRRELDETLLRRSQVWVEDVSTSLREAGDIVLAERAGALGRAQLHPIADLVTGRTTAAADRPRVFKGTGMSWQDVVLAARVQEAVLGSGPVAGR